MENVTDSPNSLTDVTITLLGLSYTHMLRRTCCGMCLAWALRTQNQEGDPGESPQRPSDLMRRGEEWTWCMNAGSDCQHSRRQQPEHAQGRGWPQRWWTETQWCQDSRLPSTVHSMSCCLRNDDEPPRLLVTLKRISYRSGRAGLFVHPPTS